MLGIMLDVIENPLGLGADINVLAGERNRNISGVSSVTELKFGLDPLVGFNIDLIEDSLLVFSGLNSLLEHRNLLRERSFPTRRTKKRSR